MAQKSNDDLWAAEELLLRAAWYYYVDGLTQDDIAKRLAISRASAGRLLERSRQSGIVRFTISSDYYESFQLARTLKERFDLREALVLPALDDPDDQDAVNARLGRGAAQYLQSHLKPGETLGMGWGATVQQTLQSLPADILARVGTVTLTGGVEAYISSLQHVTSARSETVRDWVLPAPIVASSERLAAALLAEDAVTEVLERAKRADHALVGIGAILGKPTLAQVGYTSVDELAEFAARGAVGDILGVFYNAEGNIVDLPLHRRRIGIDLDDLRAIPNVVGVAGGRAKKAAVQGALRGRYLDVLVTTEDLARDLVEEEIAA